MARKEAMALSVQNPSPAVKERMFRRRLIHVVAISQIHMVAISQIDGRMHTEAQPY